MDIPGQGFKSELQLPAYTRATATPGSSHIYDHLWQRRILNPLSEARDQLCILRESVLGA